MEIKTKFNLKNKVFTVLEGFDIAQQETSKIIIEPTTDGNHCIEYLFVVGRAGEENAFQSFEDAREYAKKLAKEKFERTMQKIERLKSEK